MLRLVAALLVLLPLAASATEKRHLAATLFGETVGEVRLTLDAGVITYRSEMRVIRDRVRLKQTAFIESRFDPATGALVKSIARRCTGPEDASEKPACGETKVLVAADAQGAVPALAAEVVLARATGHACVPVIDEESGLRGEACADVTHDGAQAELDGTKLGRVFRAKCERGLMFELSLPQQGALFTAVDGKVELSDADLFADPIPASASAADAVRRGRVRLRVNGPPEALEKLSDVQAPGQRVLAKEAGAVALELARVDPPRTKRARAVLDRVALLVAEARGSHVDCQTATQWFLAKARERRWKARPAVGIAFVDGRFAFHEWAVVETPDGPVPVDPLLAQVPADAGHLQLSSGDGAAASLLVEFVRGVSIEVE